ncbi:ABC transporter permease [Neorhizobium sp. JUb45]|uniref:ABC transporter permease n=1 Tax=Neorhizobium sp. JUb45 TaxID=2485113 RepID=UPI0010EF474F|nr:ABC transporter permease [Neorhizobium sp. JUb45]TCR00460.1 putative ABC transport system permease protein [Neorhizobium sp. JUb45]
MMVSLTVTDLGLAAALLLANAILMSQFSLGDYRSLIWSAARMIVQLLMVGTALRFVFSYNLTWLTLLVFTVMLTAASFETGARLPARLAAGLQLVINGTSITISTSVISAFALVTVFGFDGWLDARHAIPIAGIILGTAMNSASIALNTFFNGIALERNAIEAQLALGRTRWEALAPLVRRSIRSGLLPVTNQMVGAGIITMPGIMSGQILAGQDPYEAGKYQIFLMLLLASCGALSTFASVLLTVLGTTDDRHRLRTDRLS